MHRSKRPHRGPVDPLFAPAGSSSNDRKALQLCGQVQDALSRAFPDCADPLLQSLYVDDVLPAPDAGHLLVICRSPEDPGSLPEILTALAKVRVRLRTAVAGEITRRRVPELSFNVSLSGGSEEE